jgi:L-lactate utilization protein LutB
MCYVCTHCNLCKSRCESLQNIKSYLSSDKTRMAAATQASESSYSTANRNASTNSTQKHVDISLE